MSPLQIGGGLMLPIEFMFTGGGGMLCDYGIGKS